MSPRKARYELRNEKNKVHVRWLVVLVIAGYFGYVLLTGKEAEIGASRHFTWPVTSAITGTLAFLNIILTAFLDRVLKGKASMHPFIKYATMFCDFAAVSLVLAITGGDQSMLFVVYFVVIVSNAIRYGMKLALAALIVFNVCYVAVLMYQYYPELRPGSLQKEILKVSGFWLVGLYTGYLARRFEILHGEVERYQELLAERVKGGNPS